ncbi:Transcriptional activator protein NhaR [Rubripirellula obstinata]|uniref:Transcriptional activator protein NhaR n=1 Tax=Rubripirellula obstinata TaxID=406547 RepID=A0A5B1CJV3_9BACT|nr:transcriptional activator NhaR [Rubripirellula obstinata]KAA1259594.1 Transcriptional activator protein NhaR [Rubripirellula obstinata]
MTDWLNYHHLLYFWMVAKEGGITRAAELLHLSQPTLSTQIQKLEKSLGVKLFERKGRTMLLTDTGQTVFRYADEIFNLGRELTDAVRGRASDESLRLMVGIPDVLPKTMVYRLLKPVLEMEENIKLVCYEGKLNDLLSDLAMHRLDVVLANSRLTPDLNVRAFNHLLGQCDVTVLGTAEMAKKYRTKFPGSLNGAPMLLPTQNTTMRRALEQWFDDTDIRPETMHEFEDSALMKVFGQAGAGMLAVPTPLAEEIEKQYSLKTVGRIPEVTERFYAISVERRLKHPAVVTISETAKASLFEDPVEEG